MRDLQGQLMTEVGHQIGVRCFEAIEYAGRMTDVRLDHLDLTTDEGRVVRLPLNSIIAIEFQAKPGS